ncbi:four-helix bundle copper-binding protein [Mucilaginibacter gynuensis]
MKNNSEYQDLIRTLLDCVLACENCASACLQEDDVKMMAGCVSLDRDCADICALAARLLQRGADISLQYLLLCEEICRQCATECSKHEHVHCQKCAEACNNCAQACHKYHEPITQN